MSGRFLFVAKLLKTGEWKTFNTTTSFRGHEVTEILFARKPTVEELDEVFPAFGDRPVRCGTLDEAARARS
jgi:hypothetical protein